MMLLGFLLLLIQVISTLSQSQVVCRSCNIVYYQFGSLLSVCRATTCNFRYTDGPKCITSEGELLVCNNTTVPTSHTQAAICNCDGPVTLNSTSFNNTLDSSLLATYQPISCNKTTPPTVPIADPSNSVCSVSGSSQTCSFFSNNSSTLRVSCLAPGYDPAHPTLVETDEQGNFTCDGTLRTRINDAYICNCARNLEQSEVLGIMQHVQGGGVPPAIPNCWVQKPSDILVDVDTAMKLVQNAVVDLHPVIDLIPT